MITDNSYNKLVLDPLYVISGLGQNFPTDSSANYINAMSGILRASLAPDNDTEKRTAFIRLNGITGTNGALPNNTEIALHIKNNFSNIRSPYTDGATNYELCYNTTPGSKKFTLRYYEKDSQDPPQKISGTEFNILNAIIENDIIKFCRFVDYNQTVGTSDDDKFPESSTGNDKYSYQYPVYGASTLYGLSNDDVIGSLYQALTDAPDSLVAPFTTGEMTEIVALRYNGGALSQGTKIINPLPNSPSSNNNEEEEPIGQGLPGEQGD